MKNAIYGARDTSGFQREVKLGACKVIATEITEDALGNRGVSLCFMDSLGQFDTRRFDMLSDAARVVASLLLAAADACDKRGLERRVEETKKETEP